MYLYIFDSIDLYFAGLCLLYSSRILRPSSIAGNGLTARLTSGQRCCTWPALIRSWVVPISNILDRLPFLPLGDTGTILARWLQASRLAFLRASVLQAGRARFWRHWFLNQLMGNVLAFRSSKSWSLIKIRAKTRQYISILDNEYSYNDIHTFHDAYTGKSNYSWISQLCQDWSVLCLYNTSRYMHNTCQYMPIQTPSEYRQGQTPLV